MSHVVQVSWSTVIRSNGIFRFLHGVARPVEGFPTRIPLSTHALDAGALIRDNKHRITAHGEEDADNTMGPTPPASYLARGGPMAHVCRRRRGRPPTLVALARAAGSGEALAPQAARVVSRAPWQASPCDACDAFCPGVAWPMVRWEPSVLCGATGHLHALAAAGMPAGLAVDLSPGSPAAASAAASAHPPEGSGPSHVGPGAYCPRTVAHARPARGTASHAQVHAAMPGPRSRPTWAVATLGPMWP
jgi:hypothetical protein